jgi:DNA-binding phage protein
MRFFEFADSGMDTLITVLRNYIGRAASKKAPVKLNWNGLNKVLKSSGLEQGADYESFKSMYDSNPALQSIVKNFNAAGVELQVPGAPESDQQAPVKSDQTSQDAVDKMAASAAPQQLASQA